MRHTLLSTVVGLLVAGGAVAAQAQQAPTSVPPSDAPTQTPGTASPKGLPPLDAPLHIKAINITGNQRLTTGKLLAAVPFKVGSTASQAHITGGLQNIIALYQKNNLTGHVKQALDINGHDVKVNWAITEAENPPATQQAFVVEDISFDGNLHVATSDLKKASSLQKGQVVTPERMLADEKAMQALYVKKSIGVTITPKVTHPHNDNRVAITYRLDEKSPD